MRSSYPHLASFLGGWFNQDFDLFGSTLEEVVAEFKRSAAPGESGVICREIDRFLADHGAAAGQGFAEVFDIGVDPLGFAPTIQAFLLAIREQLNEQV